MLQSVVRLLTTVVMLSMMLQHTNSQTGNKQDFVAYMSALEHTANNSVSKK